MYQRLEPAAYEILRDDLPVRRAMGIAPERPVKPRLARLIHAAREKAVKTARPRLLVWTGSAEMTLSLFPSDSGLERHLGRATHGALIVGTAGHEMDQAIQDCIDPLARYALHAAATALARGTLSVAAKFLDGILPALQAGPLLSPGNAGLDFQLQRALLHQMPIERIGITFDTETFVMQPAASVTAIAGLGSALAPADSSCRACPSVGCTLRIESFKRDIAPLTG